MELNEIWTQTFDVVRRDLAVPTVWLAMQATRPLLLDGNYFVVALPKQDEYLASHLQDDQASTAIEEALRNVTGRILAFRLVQGETVADWQAQKARETTVAPAPAPPPPPAHVPAPPPPPLAHATMRAAAPAPPPPAEPQPATPFPAGPRPVNAAPAPTREVNQTWEKLNERLSHGYKNAPFIKYPHGQAQYVLEAVRMISDTMDVLMPPPGAPRDDAQERMLSKTIERLKGVVDLDPMFLSLELLRYRDSQSKG